MARPEKRLREVLLDHERLVAPVSQALHRLSDWEPYQFVDLDARAEAATLHLHHPVARNFVSVAAVDVCGAAQRPHELTPEAGLFLDLAQSAVLGSFVRLDLALGQSPIVISGAVDDGDLGLVRWSGPADNAARRPDHSHID